MSQDTPETRRALGAQLTKRRHQLGLSQTALAAAAGVATGTTVSAERGKPVQPIKLAAITAALGADIVSFRAFPDHHPYSLPDMEALRRNAEQSGASLIVTQ